MDRSTNQQRSGPAMTVTTLYAATGRDLVRIAQDDLGGWRVSTLIHDTGVRCLAVDPADQARVYAGTLDDGLFRSRDGGETWEQAGGGIPHQRIMSIAFAPHASPDGPSTVYVGTEPSSLYRSDDDGRTWRDLAALRDLPSQPSWSFPPRPWTSHVRAIALHPQDPDTLYVGIELGGVMVSRDAGETWEDRKPGSYDDCHALATHPLAPDRVYEAGGGGVAWSRDAGRTWETADDGLRHRYVWSVVVDPADPDLWYVSAASGANSAHRKQGDAGAGIYRKRGDAPWRPITGGSSGLPEALPWMPYALVTHRDAPGSVIAAFQHGELWQSDDQGESWTRLDLTGDPLEAIDAVAVGA
jgi:photosystem II stability/assembly factor-like uncharacterized protein